MRAEDVAGVIAPQKNDPTATLTAYEQAVLALLQEIADNTRV